MEYDENEEREQHVINLQQAINKLLNDQRDTYTTLFYLNENLRRTHALGVENLKQHEDTVDIMRNMATTLKTHCQSTNVVIPVKAMIVSGLVAAGTLWCLLRIFGAA